MSQPMSPEELALISAMKPFTSPRGQRLIDTFINLVNRPEVMDESGNIDADVLKKQVASMLNSQVNDVIDLFVLFSLLGGVGGSHAGPSKKVVI